MSNSKYNSVRCDGYDSKAEAKRAYELQLMERAGLIKDLQEQVKFIVCPEQRDSKGKLLEHEAYYLADFVYIDCKTGLKITEDVKGVRTPLYTLKRKLVLLNYGIRIKET